MSLRGAHSATTPALPGTCAQGKCALGASEQSPYSWGLLRSARNEINNQNLKWIKIRPKFLSSFSTR